MKKFRRTLDSKGREYKGGSREERGNEEQDID